MKKAFMSFLIFIMLPIILISCAPKSRPVEDCCAEVISLMNEMIDSEEYIKLYNMSTTCDDTIAEMKSTDFSKPDAIYMLDIESNALLSEVDTEKLSEELKSYVNSGMYSSIASRINQKAGTNSMTVSSVFSAQKVFLCDSVKENTVFLYVYENGYAIVVTVLPGESGSASVRGTFIINDSFNTDNAEQIEDYLVEIGIKAVVTEKK